MKAAIKKGLGFGLASGIITTLGLMVGLYSSTSSKIAVVGGILIIAIADAMSDAFGIHISEEYSKKKRSGIWSATISTFAAKFLFALSFLIPLFFFELLTAVTIGAIWGIIALSVISWRIAKDHKANAWKITSEHVFTAVVVILITYYLGMWISLVFV